MQEQVKVFRYTGGNTMNRIETVDRSSMIEKFKAQLTINPRTTAVYGTDLEILLRTLKADTVVLIGINTNTCVQCTAFEAYNRDFKTVVISDCVGSMYGEDLHVFGLQNVSRCLGWVLTIDEFKEKLENSTGV
jgi:nicotinamidase-related amidase